MERGLSWIRLAVGILAAGLTWPALGSGAISAAWLLAPIAPFLILVVVHDRVIRRRRRAERSVAYYERGMARIEDRWAGTGSQGERFVDADHPYAADLDLFGRGSLFELLSTARTEIGEETLAGWLAHAAEPGEIRERQQAVDELRPELDLREDLALLGEELGAGVQTSALRKWATEPTLLPQTWPAFVAPVLAVANLAALIGWLVPLFDPARDPSASYFEGSLPFWLLLLASGGLALLFQSRVSRILAAVDRPASELQALSALLERLESESFESAPLRQLRAALDTDGVAPSRRIRQLARQVQINDSRANMMFAPLSALTLTGTQLAFAFERWRLACGPVVGRWLDAVGRFEALGSLASFSYEHPNDPFPTIVDAGPSVEARELGHPLLPESNCVRNDVAFGPTVQLWLVSGSNMSGKSTLLRTIGTNVVLALAGAPVRAGSMSLSPLTLGACMRVQDSLQDGKSHFYAEIQRLRRIVDLSRGSRPLLFLFDEILHGTNSHDRRIGADALIRGLVEAGSMGLVTTHDLALAQIAESLGERARNVHFADHLEDQRLVFDYRVAEGVVRKSNALELMRNVGLDV